MFFGDRKQLIVSKTFVNEYAYYCDSDLLCSNNVWKYSL